MKLKRMIPGLLCASALAGNQPVMAVDLNVVGRIQPRGACDLTLLNGGVVDLGVLSASQVEKSDTDMIGGNTYYIIGRIRDRISIRCQDATRLALRALDNRSGTGTENDNPYTYGLGLSDGSKVGVYRLRVGEVLGDGQRINSLQSWDSGGAWREKYGSSEFGGEATQVSWAEPGQGLPQAFRAIFADLEGGAMVSTDLDMKTAILIDGSATLELVYL